MTAFVPQTAASGQIAQRNKTKKSSKVFPCVVLKPGESGEMHVARVMKARQPKRLTALGI